jgi:hypothetical protein
MRATPLAMCLLQGFARCVGFILEEHLQAGRSWIANVRNGRTRVVTDNVGARSLLLKPREELTHKHPWKKGRQVKSGGVSLLYIGASDMADRTLRGYYSIPQTPVKSFVYVHLQK